MMHANAREEQVLDVLQRHGVICEATDLRQFARVFRSRGQTATIPAA